MPGKIAEPAPESAHFLPEFVTLLRGRLVATVRAGIGTDRPVRSHFGVRLRAGTTDGSCG